MLVESKKIEAAMCFYNALNVHPSPGYLLDVYQKTVPQPVLDALHERIAINTATATERIPYSTEIGEEAYFSKLGEEEACLMKEFSRGQDLCQNEDQDGPFVQTPPNDRMLMDPSRKDEDRSSNVLLQGPESPPVTCRPH